MCNLDVHIVMRDRDVNKVIEYNSISHDKSVFTMEDAKALIEQFKGNPKRRNFKLYTDDDYDSLKVHPRGGDFLDHNSDDDLAVGLLAPQPTSRSSMAPRMPIAISTLPVQRLEIAASKAIAAIPKANTIFIEKPAVPNN